MRRAPLRYLVALNHETLPDETDPDYKFRYIDISQVTATGAVLIPDEVTKFGEAPSRARRLARPGDTVVSTVRTYLRAIAEVPHSPDPLVFSTGFAVLSPTNVDARFLGYACRSETFISEVVSRSVGVSYPAINAGDLVSISVPVYEREEQRRVADFLDVRIAQIDRIIAARKKQLALAELIRASRLQAESDRLTAQFGDVRLAYAVSRIEQGWSPQADATPASRGEWGVMRAGSVNGGIFRADDNKRLPDDLTPRADYEIRPGDLLMSRASGSLDLIGSVAVVPDDVRQRLLLCDKLYRRTPGPGWKADFLAPMLRVHSNRERIRLGVSGAEGMANNLPTGVVRDLRIPHVPVELQPTLAERISRREADVARVRAGMTTSINLLTEYKTSLITAAVAGELDVTTAGSGIPG